MAVVLVGVGADSEHLRPKLQLTEEGYFDYIPISESHPTTETLTYGRLDLDHRGGTAADYVTALSPKGEDSDWIDDPAEIESHPVHHDPNFEAMTFGDRRGGGGKGSILIDNFGSSEETDVLGFYTGVKENETDSNVNRFLYGYMTVEAVHDLSKLEGEKYHEALQEFPENAHTKRLEAAGTPKHDDIVIIEGRTPSAKIDQPVKISERIDQAPWYRVAQEFADEYNVQGGQKGIGRKFPLVLDLGGEEFIKKIESESNAR